ncbi:hypothetical protein BDY21DRAFT_335253 [Lineolata rhizophorae]|uniref:Uncharacterized protein n=1 Tax=Lineolata rhizophorae TaxID=578093 RepID=A0A6A6P938_9PEZI|nr:hypothetical protein BDY21DRAFT_335253 [Lineolata rhizophorae]
MGMYVDGGGAQPETDCGAQHPTARATGPSWERVGDENVLYQIDWSRDLEFARMTQGALAGEEASSCGLGISPVDRIKGIHVHRRRFSRGIPGCNSATAPLSHGIAGYSSQLQARDGPTYLGHSCVLSFAGWFDRTVAGSHCLVCRRFDKRFQRPKSRSEKRRRVRVRKTTTRPLAGFPTIRPPAASKARFDQRPRCQRAAIVQQQAVSSSFEGNRPSRSQSSRVRVDQKSLISGGATFVICRETQNKQTNKNKSKKK